MAGAVNFLADIPFESQEKALKLAGLPKITRYSDKEFLKCGGVRLRLSSGIGDVRRRARAPFPRHDAHARAHEHAALELQQPTCVRHRRACYTLRSR